MMLKRMEALRVKLVFLFSQPVIYSFNYFFIVRKSYPKQLLFKCGKQIKSHVLGLVNTKDVTKF